MHVGHNKSSTSPGWSLLPSSILIVLALVNSDVPHQGTWVSQRDPRMLPHSLTVLLPQDCCAFWLVPVSIVVEATSKWTAWLPPHVFRIRCVTYIPGRTVAVLNIDSSVQQHNIGQVYNIRANSLLEDEYPQLQLIPTLHKVDDTNHNLIPFVMVNLGEDNIFLSKGQVVGFLDPECIDISEIELDIVTITVNALDSPITIKNVKQTSR